MQQQVSSGAVYGVLAVACGVKAPYCGGVGGECERCMQVSLSLSHTLIKTSDEDRPTRDRSGHTPPWAFSPFRRSSLEGEARALTHLRYRGVKLSVQFPWLETLGLQCV